MAAPLPAFQLFQLPQLLAEAAPLQRHEILQLRAAQQLRSQGRAPAPRQIQVLRGHAQLGTPRNVRLKER